MARVSPRGAPISTYPACLKSSGHLWETWNYAYDSFGRLTAADTGTASDKVQRQFTYDSLGRLAKFADVHIYEDSVAQECPDNEIFCDPPPGWDYTTFYDTLRVVSYNPDKSGNRTDGSALLTNDRLTSMTTADGKSYSFTYDAAGHRLSKTGASYSQTYGWNALGQLIWVKTNGDSVAFAYDASGRRVRKDHGTTTNRYVWDGDNLLMQLDGSGNPQYEYSEGLGVDAPISVRRSSNGKRFYFEYDAMGSVIALWDTTNTRVKQYGYDPYGYTLDSTGTAISQPIKWKGREYDGETGLYYMRARYYDPAVGRFISEDPNGLDGGINPYAFADGDPVNGSDPSGLDCDTEFTGANILRACTHVLSRFTLRTKSLR